jgi:uncharacterized protein (DUF362 family)
MSDFKVAIIPQKGYYKSQIAVKLIEYFDKNGYDFNGKTILLKPSFVLPVKDPRMALAVDTHNILIAGVAKALALRGASKIIIAEHRTIGPTRYSFYTLNVKKEVKNIKNVKFYYLDEKKRVVKTIEDPFIPDYSVKYPQLLLDGSVDFFISLPKLKMNLYTDVTLSVKNNFGLISKQERLKYHDRDSLDAHLASLTLIKKPDLIITDAIIAGEGQGPHLTTPVNTAMLVVGTNPLAVDTVCSYLIGIDPRSIRHLELLHNRGVGPLDLNNITIENKEYLEANKKVFSKPDTNLEMTPLIKSYLGEKACTEGCIGFLRGILDSYALKNGWYSLGKLNIIIGDPEIPQETLDTFEKKKTIVYGECSKKYKKYGLYFKGCPPDYVKALLKISIPWKSSLGINPNIRLNRLAPYKYFKAWAIHILQKIFRF